MVSRPVDYALYHLNDPLTKRFIPNGGITAFARALHAVLETDWMGTLDLLRQPDFQALLANYPHTQKPFLIAEGLEDYLTSGHLIRTADGSSVRSADYLSAFVNYSIKSTKQLQNSDLIVQS